MNFKTYFLFSFLFLFGLSTSVAQQNKHNLDNRIRISAEEQQAAIDKNAAIPIPKAETNTPIGEGWDKDYGRYEVGGASEITGHAELDEMHLQLEDLQAQLLAFKQREANLEAALEEVKTSLSLCCAANNTKSEDTAAYLMQNSPNPFQQNTQIQYFLPEGISTGILQIQDLNGKILQRYALNQSGLAEVKIDKKNLAAGSYVYSLEVDGQMLDSKIMIVTK